LYIGTTVAREFYHIFARIGIRVFKDGGQDLIQRVTLVNDMAQMYRMCPLFVQKFSGYGNKKLRSYGQSLWP